MKPIILIGGGGHCKSVIEAAESSGRAIAGILDMAENVGHEILGCKISVLMQISPNIPPKLNLL